MKLSHFAFVLLAPALAHSQAINLDHLNRLSSRATEVVNVTLDASTLHIASKFLSNEGGEDADAKKIIAGLKGINIRSFSFSQPGEYLSSDVEAIRSQLRNPQWKQVVQVRSKTEGDSDIYLRSDGERVLGLALISAEPKELTVVSIDGPIDVDGLHKLSGNFGIPGNSHKKSQKEEDE